MGDVMYDAALVFGELAEQKSNILVRHGLSPEQYALATLHRAENTDDNNRLAGIMDGLTHVGQTNCPVVLPLHPRTRQALDRMGYAISKKNNQKGIFFIDPVSFLDMVMLEKHAKIIFTDSGGVQKEAYFHKVPCITLREETEWVETVAAGWNRLVGADAIKIIAAYKEKNHGSPISEYGNGKASKDMVDLLF